MKLPSGTVFKITNPFGPLEFAEEDVPLDVKRELMQMATESHVNFYWLTAIYRRGREDGAAVIPNYPLRARLGDDRCPATDDGAPAASSKRRCILIAYHDSSMNATPHLFERDDRPSTIFDAAYVTHEADDPNGPWFPVKNGMFTKRYVRAKA